MLAHNKTADAAFFSASRASHAEDHATSSLGGFFGRLRDKFIAARAARATYDQLSQLSDRELADIGLHRGELYAMFLGHSNQGR
ncbi:MAG: DUF1127 domain-containing protein [Hyphomicrobiaceae bacterium]|nr:MAG: DUF1127 domain-containing protein [Hyphomicrobiaceae bacterium]